MEEIPPLEQIPEGKNSFEEQWSNPDHVIVGDEEFDIYEASPENGGEKSKVPIVIGMGFGEISQSHINNARELVKMGRKVICPDTPHGISSSKRQNILPAGKENSDYDKIELDKMASLLETLKAKGIEIKDGQETGKAVLLARSEGAIFSILLAYLYPELVKDLILTNPAGLSGKTTKGTFALHEIQDRKQAIMNEYKEKSPAPPNTNVDFFEVLRRDLSATTSSILAISRSDIREMLKDVRAHGIGVVVIHTTDDKMFPIARLAGEVVPDPMSVTGKETIIPELTAEHVDGFWPLEGTHVSYFNDPKKFSFVIDQAISALDEKRKRRKN
ncbi:MAG: hypothetical protein NTX96_01080 [Candidatus Zambryskibacteria bacterium]|nr:hypothetical protein [Candidatus Zambryskibacteria bacterium]